MVTEDVTVGSRITVNGDVHLVLYDGVTLTASRGIEVSSGNSLTISAGNSYDIKIPTGDYAKTHKTMKSAE